MIGYKSLSLGGVVFLLSFWKQNINQIKYIVLLEEKKKKGKAAKLFKA